MDYITKSTKEIVDIIKEETYIFDEDALCKLYWMIREAKLYIQVGFNAYTLLCSGVTAWIINEAEYFSKYGIENHLTIVWAPWVFCTIFKHFGIKKLKHILSRLDEFERYGIRIIHIDDIANGEPLSFLSNEEEE